MGTFLMSYQGDIIKEFQQEKSEGTCNAYSQRVIAMDVRDD
jgi:hypothetical protein